MLKSKIRRSISLLMAVVLLLSTFAVGSSSRGNVASAASVPVSAEVSESASADEFVRIKNKWTSHYLYEDESGIIRYGFPATTDTSSHWAIEAGTSDHSYTTIRNKATGRYITMANVEARSSMLTSAEVADINAAWIIEPAVNREGQFTIRSAKLAGESYYIHEEDQLEYAQVSGDIGADWESPQWSFEPAPSTQAVRIYNKYRQAYIYEVIEDGEDQGKIEYGQTPYSDAASHWYVDEVVAADDEGSGVKIIELRNALTGNVITQGTLWAHIAAKPQTTSTKSHWIMAAAPNEGYITFTNVYAAEGGEDAPDEIPQGTYVLNTQFEDTFVRSNDWSNVNNDNAQWRIEIVPAVQPVRLVNYSDISDENSKIYLFEEQGLVKYGALDADSAAYQWVLEDYNGNKRIRNLSSGRYISSEHIKESNDPLEVLHEDGSSGQWKLNESDLYDNFVSIESVSKAGQFIHVADQIGYAQAGTVQPTDHDAQWYLEDPTASADGEPQIVQIRNVWNSMYLYEDDNHVLKYGNARPGDQRAEWIITRYNGRNLIQNHATGHYLNILHQTTGQLPLSSLNIAELTEAELQHVLWRIKDNGGGKNIWSARDLNNVPGEQVYINVQNLTKYAEYSAVNPNWGSPKWQFVSVTDNAMQYKRIRSKSTNEYLYEEDGIVKYGVPAETDFNSHWYIEEAGGSKVIRNRATGHYISMQPAGSDESEIENTALPVRSIEVEAAWASHKWIVEEDGEFVAFKNGWTNDHYLTIRDELDYLQRIRSAELASTGAEESIWFAFENAPNMSQYVRIKNKGTDDYWYEQDKQLKYGDVDIADSRTHWFLEDAGDGAQYVRNRATGHYINIEFMDRDHSESAISVEHFEMEWGSASPKWIVEAADTPGHIQFRNVWNDWRYLSTKDKLGHVQQVEHAEAEDDRIQFVMEGVPAGQLLLPTEAIRIKNVANDQYLLQTPQNIVAYGEPALDNGYSHWTIESIDGVQRVRNLATGMYISLTPDYRYVEMTVDGSTEKSNWIVEGAPIGDVYMIRSNLPGYKDEYLNTNSALGYPERGLQLISDQSLHWIFEAAPAEAVTPPQNDDNAANAVTTIWDDSNFVRIVNKSSGELLLEQGGKLVSSSAASHLDEARAQWLIQDYNGHKLLKNRASGQLLNASDDGISLAEFSNRPIELGAQWKLQPILGYQKFESVLKSGQWLQQVGDHIHYGAAGDDASEWTLDPVAGTVRYEAEKAFASGGATVISGGAAAEAGFATGFTETGARIIMAVNGQADEEYEGAIRFRNPAAAAQTLTLKVNGLSLGQLEFAATGQGAWQEVEVMLPLRTGYNSVSLERTAADTGTGQIEIDAVVVQNNMNLAYRGATLPYITYEAEHMATNGTPIGPSRVYLDVASEASGRQAVKLDQTGHYVEFQAAQEANSIVVRYSIPDAPTGGGIESTIGVYVDGEFRTELNLNSAYAWVYGNYPWSNDPKQGSAHRFFDDAHALVGDIPAGSTVRLEVREADNAEYYIIDLIDLEMVAPALEMPDGFLSITDFGAIANDGLDDTAALRSAMEAAKAEDKGVWIPAGTFEVGDGLLILDDITIRGAGKWYTKLNEAKFFGNGSNIGIYDLMIDGKISVRDDEAQTNGFEGAFGSGSTVQHVWIEHTKTGFWLTRPINKGGYTFNTELSTNEFYIAGSRIRNVMADGINFSVNTKNSMAEHMNIRYPGDDGMAMWSFLENVPTDFTENNTYRFNTVQLPWLANNIIVFGGKNHKIQDNIVMDTVAHGAGISVSTKFTPTPYEGTILVERNTLIRTGSDDAGAGYSTGAIWIYAYDRDIDTEVNIRHNTALDSTYYGLSIGGARTLGSFDSQRAKVTVEDMVIDGVGLTGVQISSTIKGAINFKNVVIRNTKLGNIHNGAGTNFTIHDLAEEQEPNNPRPGNPGIPQEDDSDEVSPRPGSAEDNDKRLGEGPTKQNTIELSADAQGSAELSLAALLAAAKQYPNGAVAVSSNKASYVLPLALAEAIKQYAGKEGAAEGESDGTLVIKVSAVSEQLRGEIAGHALAAGLKVTGDPVHFQLLLKQGNSQLELTNFGRTYMQHMMTIEGKLDSKLSTVMSYDPASKKLFYAPARFTIHGDETTVTVMSPSNGIFFVVQGMKTFSDSSNHWARESIELLATKRIVFGKSEDRFAPQHSITRAEFAALLVRSLGLKDGGNTMHFSDIQPSDWFYGDVSIAAQYGLVSGLGDGRFQPNDSITREQMAVMAANALAISGSVEGAAAVFHDQDDISPWARSAVEHMVKQGIMNGKQSLHFAPKDEATRAEAVIVLMRMLQSMELLDEINE